MSADPFTGLTMSYDALVAAGREARHQADDVQWVQGDLALQVDALPPTERPRDPETGEFLADEAKALRRYADDIDIPYGTVKKYRATAQAWPPEARASGVAWKTHERLNGQGDRFALIAPGMTVRQAEQIVRHRNAASRGKPGWFEMLGEVGDTLIRAGKQLSKAEDAIDREPSDELAAKAEQYAMWADDLVARLRRIGRSE